jgi:hypothetical protein
MFVRVTERLDFRVRQTRSPMPSAPDDFAAPNQHRPDHRIRRSLSEATARQAQSQPDIFQLDPILDK